MKVWIMRPEYYWRAVYLTPSNQLVLVGGLLNHETYDGAWTEWEQLRNNQQWLFSRGIPFYSTIVKVDICKEVEIV